VADCNTQVGTNNEFYIDADPLNTSVNRCVSQCSPNTEAIKVADRTCVPTCISPLVRKNQTYTSSYSSDTRTTTNADACITDDNSKRYFYFNGAEVVLTDDCDPATRVVEFHTV
jgi:hypothetical protein